MTTREIYFKNLIRTDLPQGYVWFIYRDKENIIQVGKNIVLEFRTDEATVIKNLKFMENVEKSEGFMFWNLSPEGEELIRSIKFNPK